MTVALPPPQPPTWALREGLPPPRVRESFTAYARRLGIPRATIRAMGRGLNPMTAVVANARLASYIARSCPRAFWRAVHRGRSRYSSGDSQ